MINNINILITSVGRRTRLLEYFKKELNGLGKLIAADCDILAPALYTADSYHIVPRINDPKYVNIIKNICEKEKVSATISLIDPELSMLAKHAEEFKDSGVTAVDHLTRCGALYQTCSSRSDKKWF